MPGMSGLETFQAIREIEPKLPVIIMTAFGTTETAIEATKMGAFDYVLKPFDIPDILALIDQALEAGRFMRSRVEHGRGVPDTPLRGGHHRPEQSHAGGLQGHRPGGAHRRHGADPGGIGHRQGTGGPGHLSAQPARRTSPSWSSTVWPFPRPCWRASCSAMRRGPSPGRSTAGWGRSSRPTAGTVFLDEIGDMPFSIQAKILRLLQEKSIERLGGREPIPVDVRIIAATNRDLEAALAEGRFREDLYYRLKVVTIWLPPLRERAGDIPLLADYFLARFAAEMEVENPGIAEEAKAMLGSHSWPGNVRELANTLQKALIFSRGCPCSCGGRGPGHNRREGGPEPQRGGCGTGHPHMGARRHRLRTRRRVVRVPGGSVRQRAHRRGPEPHGGQPHASGQNPGVVPTHPPVQDREIRTADGDVRKRGVIRIPPLYIL